MDFYKLAQDVRKYHHSALWEIEKHFTWWVSILLGALFLFLANARNLNGSLLALAFTSTATFGFAVSLIGFMVVRREGRYFSEALQICNRAAKALGLDVNVYTGQQRPKPNAAPQAIEFKLHPDEYPHGYRVTEFGEVSKKANKRFALLKIFSPRLNVRDYFQIVLATSVVVFAVFLAVAVLGAVFKSGPLGDALSSPLLAADISPSVPHTGDRFVQIAVASQQSRQLALYALDESGQVWSLVPGSQAWTKILKPRQLPPSAAGPAPTSIR